MTYRCRYWSVRQGYASQLLHVLFVCPKRQQCKCSSQTSNSNDFSYPLKVANEDGWYCTCYSSFVHTYECKLPSPFSHATIPTAFAHPELQHKRRMSSTPQRRHSSAGAVRMSSNSSREATPYTATT